MALSGLDIYKLLPKTNCKDCGFATCLAFAMALAQKKVSLDKCPHVTAQARESLDSASQPPVKLVTIGRGESKLEIGNETVMFRHEQKFHHPCGIAFLIDDTLDDSSIDEKISNIKGLRLERVGLVLKPDLIYVRNSSNDKGRFLKAVKKCVASGLNLILSAQDPKALEESLGICKDKRPLILCGQSASIDPFVRFAKENSLPIAVTAADLDEAARLTDDIKKQGIDEIIINLKTKAVSSQIEDLTYMRRFALKKNFRPLGFPAMVSAAQEDPAIELCEAISYIAKYAGIVVIQSTDKDFVLPLLVARQDIYTDPQKPVQVEPKIYEIGKVSNNSPVIVTTNFSITYFTVAGEVEASKVATYLVCVDSEGMSVLTAWAAEKFTAEMILDALKKYGIESKVSHKKVIIPGYVSVLSGKLEEISGWKVLVGPREASGLPNYLRNLS